jgi:hypothetical protein
MAASMNKETFEWTRALEDEFIEIWAANPIKNRNVMANISAGDIAVLITVLCLMMSGVKNSTRALKS